MNKPISQLKKDNPRQFTLERDCNHWLDRTMSLGHRVDLTEDLATFVQQKVDEERKRCVEVLVKYLETNMFTSWLDSTDPEVNTAIDFYTRLLSVEGDDK
jgi:hypothetical protein